MFAQSSSWSMVDVTRGVISDWRRGHQESRQMQSQPSHPFPRCRVKSVHPKHRNMVCIYDANQKKLWSLPSDWPHWWLEILARRFLCRWVFSYGHFHQRRRCKIRPRWEPFLCLVLSQDSICHLAKVHKPSSQWWISSPVSSSWTLLISHLLDTEP